MQTAKPVRPEGVPVGHVLVEVADVMAPLGETIRVWVTPEVRDRIRKAPVGEAVVNVADEDVFLDETGIRLLDPDAAADTEAPPDDTSDA